METLTSITGALAAFFSVGSALLLARYGLIVRARLCWGAALVAMAVVTSMGATVLRLHPVAPLCVFVVCAAAAEAVVGALQSRWRRAWLTLAHALLWGTHLVCNVFGSSQWSSWIGAGMSVGLASFAAIAWPRWRASRTAPPVVAFGGGETRGEQVLITSPGSPHSDGFAHED